jgi:5-methylcytosine-specific restriction protein A
MPPRAYRPYASNPTVNRENFDAQRQSDPIRKLYKTATWRATRLAILFRDPVCKVCQKAASTVADHIIAARRYIAQNAGDPCGLFFDENNLQGVCKACHDAKTAKECGWAGGASR